MLPLREDDRVPRHGQIVHEAETNTSVTLRAYGAGGTPLAGILIRVTIEDRGEGGTFSTITI